MPSGSKAACCGDVDYLRVYSDASKDRTVKYEHEVDLSIRRPVSFPSEFRSEMIAGSEVRNRIIRNCCPLKPGFRCGAMNAGTSASAIARATQGICYREMCPYIRRRITDDPGNVLGSRSRCDPDEFSLKVMGQRRRLAQQEEEDGECRIPWDF